eukprot:gene5281-7341_t
MDLKWVALVALVIQNSGLAVMMRMSFLFVSTDGKYIPSTAVLLAEIMKLLIATVTCYYYDANLSWDSFKMLTYNEFVLNKWDWVKLMIPSLLYTLQNSLQYYSMSVLSAPVFQVLYQMKIITTAMFSVIILSKRLNSSQWVSIVSLSCGVALVQLSQVSDNVEDKSNSIFGLLSVVMGCLTSGFAGVYFEMVLKSSPASIWLRNIQLALIGTLFSLISCFYRDYNNLQSQGFFIGYNAMVVGVIVLQAAGGLIVAVVVKYADNVLKGFATSLSILLSCLVSLVFFHDIIINNGFIFGAMIVLGSVYLYGYQPNTNQTMNKTPSTSQIKDGKSSLQA